METAHSLHSLLRACHPKSSLETPSQSFSRCIRRARKMLGVVDKNLRGAAVRLRGRQGGPTSAQIKEAHVAWYARLRSCMYAAHALCFHFTSEMETSARSTPWTSMYYFSAFGVVFNRPGCERTNLLLFSLFSIEIHCLPGKSS